ncbi:PaaX family transcriptional regulator C-terminal domain-containing protein [Arthrobacter ginkgonis]|uniref:PaaX family transcriptional regulator C-terminal domain-containing protein n=1 Tax=Arthrobacter ginkgonis TaxID=1630594 RepID=A0ABP7BRM5_9MICC
MKNPAPPGTAPAPADASRLPRPHTGKDSQHILVSLLGDYWYARSEPLPSAALVSLLAEFGANEMASRQAMRRLTAAGLLTQSKQGRTTFYGIPSPIVQDQLQRLDRAIKFGADFTDWDGQWTVVSYSIPETERDTRRHLRNGLKALHFGVLQDGMWISPRNLEAEALALLDELHVGRGHVMRARWRGRLETPDALAQAFDLESLAAAYEDFIARHQETLRQVTTAAVEPSQALIRRTMLTSEWLAFRSIDPELPAELLPPNWPRPRARTLFMAIYDALAPNAVLRFRQIIAGHDEQLAQLAQPHSPWGGTAI